MEPVTSGSSWTTWKEVRAALQREDVTVAPSGSVDFTDPWGNHVQVVDYRDIQFEKTPAVLAWDGSRSDREEPAALAELRAKDLPDSPDALDHAARSRGRSR